MLRVTLLADEWGSSKGGLSTINRELVKQLAKHPNVKVAFFVPKCSDKDKSDAVNLGITVVEAKEQAGFEPVDWLAFPPSDLSIDIIVGHGVKFGRQAQIIRESHHCKWVQVVHIAPEELAMYKSYSGAISRGGEKHQTEIQLCEMADFVVAVGPKLADDFTAYFRSCKKEVFDLTPGIFDEFFHLEQASQDGKKFRVLVFGLGDSEDFELKGLDIAAQAVAELSDPTYHLIFVETPSGKEEEVKQNLLKHGISQSQLTVRSVHESREKLANLFCEADLAIMPSRTEGFGLTALEALSAGLPVLVSSNSGFGEALRKVPFGSSCVVDSEDAKVWAKTIKNVREKDREERLEECKTLRISYSKHYDWQKTCEALVEKLLNIDRGFLSRPSWPDECGIVTETKRFEAEHKECLRVLPYRIDREVVVELYVHCGMDGIPEDLKADAQKVFEGLHVKLKWSDLYNEAYKVLNTQPIRYPSGNPTSLNASETRKITKAINDHLLVFSKHRNITALKASYQVKQSKETSTPCITAYVLGKGRIPIGESEIPSCVGGYRVDILEGFWFECVNMPSEAQRSHECLELGVSIGVKGETHAGSLGAVLEDMASGTLYALSCNHVMKSSNASEQAEITHPGLLDNIQWLKWNLECYKEILTQVPGPQYREMAVDVPKHASKEQLWEHFARLRGVKENHLKLLTQGSDGTKDPPFADTCTDEEGLNEQMRFLKLRDDPSRCKSRVSSWRKRVKVFEENFEESYFNEPRTIADYTVGVGENVKWAGDRDEYFIDAAIAKLHEDEIEKLRDAGRIRVFGISDLVSSECTPATEEEMSDAEGLSKSGRTTGFRERARVMPKNEKIFLHESQSVVSPFVRNAEMKSYYCCEKCASLSSVSTSQCETSETPHVCETCHGIAAEYGQIWRRNCLCITGDGSGPLADEGDSGAVVFKKRYDPKEKQFHLTPFGIVFAVFSSPESSNVYYTIVSPLDIALKELSRRVSSSCDLRVKTSFD